MSSALSLDDVVVPIRSWILALGLSLSLLAGCMAPQGPRSVSVSTSPQGDLAFYEPAVSQTGEVSVRIIDQRRASQSLDEANSDAAFNAVLFRLGNPSKLKHAQVRSVGRSADGTYQAVFTGLPSGGGYSMSAGLFRDIAAPNLSSDAGYSQLPNKVGEGVSAPFSIAAGAQVAITITVNAVGDLGFGAVNFCVDQVTPVLLLGSGTAFVDTRVSVAKSPLVDSLSVFVLDAARMATLSTVVAPLASWSLSPSATVSFPVPAAAGNYHLCVEATGASSDVLSRRYRAFAVDTGDSLAGERAQALMALVEEVKAASASYPTLAELNALWQARRSSDYNVSPWGGLLPGPDWIRGNDAVAPFSVLGDAEADGIGTPATGMRGQLYYFRATSDDYFWLDDLAAAGTDDPFGTTRVKGYAIAYTGPSGEHWYFVTGAGATTAPGTGPGGSGTGGVGAAAFRSPARLLRGN